VDEIIKIQKSFKILTDLKFAILILGLLALGSSLGSFIEQEESIHSMKKIMQIKFMELLIQSF
jgi:cytochrome c biogenesis protein ResB